LRSSVVRVHYVPGVDSGSLAFEVDALDVSGTVVAYGDGGPILLVAGKAVALDVSFHVGSRPGTQDGGVGARSWAVSSS
jgi:hypothetical protein